MATSVYFNHFESTPEQNLHQDLIIEAIKNYGIDVYYLPRKFVNEDLLYGEDTISEFNQAHLIEMYVKSVDGFEGEGDFVSRFGLEIRDQVVFSVARRRFDNLDITEQDRPLEGDVIFFPLNKKLYEIRFVEHESMFYQFGKLEQTPVSFAINLIVEDDIVTSVEFFSPVVSDETASQRTKLFFLILVAMADDTLDKDGRESVLSKLGLYDEVSTPDQLGGSLTLNNVQYIIEPLVDKGLLIGLNFYTSQLD